MAYLYTSQKNRFPNNQLRTHKGTKQTILDIQKLYPIFGMDWKSFKSLAMLELGIVNRQPPQQNEFFIKPGSPFFLLGSLERKTYPTKKSTNFRSPKKGHEASKGRKPDRLPNPSFFLRGFHSLFVFGGGE